MSYTLEINQQGSLQIPPDLLPQGSAYTHYQLEVEGETLILRPQKGPSFWTAATPAQRAARFREWARQTKRPPTPVIPDEALSRETIYD